MSSSIDLINITSLSEEDYVRLVYVTLLQRNIDPVGLVYWRKVIENNAFNKKELVDTIYNSPEFRMLHKTSFPGMVHLGRVQWIKTLDYYETIFDIGGSSPNLDLGAMIELGYPHRPKEILIFDLPEDQQYWKIKPKYPQDRDYIFNWGVLKYEHGRIETIDTYKNLANTSYDMIFMGQTIEHIYQDKLPNVLRWIRAHLKPNGKFIFDTPNREITKIQIPNNWIDEDHKYEYTPEEMESLLNREGLKVIKKTGILNMPGTHISKNFNPLEVYETEILNNSPETSYLFAFECSKM